MSVRAWYGEISITQLVTNANPAFWLATLLVDSVLVGTFRLDYEYEIEYEYDLRISTEPVTFPEPSLFI